MYKLNDLWGKIKIRIVCSEPKGMGPVPWFESNLLWGSIGLSSAIILTVVAAMSHDLRWLLIVAWPFSILSAWTMIKGLNLRRWVVLPFAAIMGIGLFVLFVNLDPNAKQKETTNYSSFIVQGITDAVTQKLQQMSATRAEPTANEFDQKEKPIEQLEQKTITLYERYPSQWEQTIDKTAFETSIDKKTLRAVFEKNKYYLLTSMIRNNMGIPLQEPIIKIRIPINISIQQTKQWIHNEDGSYHVFAGKINESVTSSVSLGINEHLAMGFPSIGKYPLRYIISGIVDGKEVKVNGSFVIELIKEK